MRILKKILKFIFKAFLWLFGLLLLVFGFVWMVLKVPAVQNYLVDKATHFISDKTKTTVQLNNIDLGFPKSILLQGLFLDDKNKDTLLYLNELEVDIDMLALMQKKVDVNYIGLDGLNGNLKRDKKSGKFNFQFLLDAFTKKEKEKIEIEDTTASPWGITARKLELTNCRFSMMDSVGGVYLVSSVTKFLVAVDKLDLTEKVVEIKKIDIGGVAVSFTQGISLIPDTAKPGSSPWNRFFVEDLEINNTGLNYADQVSKTSMATSIGHFKTDHVNLDLFQSIIRTGKVELARSSAQLGLVKDTANTKAASTGQTRAKKAGWLVEVQQLKLDSNSFKMDYTNVPKAKKGMDYNHLALTGIHAHVKEVFFHNSKIKSQVISLAAQEQNGFGIRSFKTDFEMDSIYARMNGFELLTNHSRIGNKVNISYSSLSNLMEDGKIDVELKNNELAFSDLLVFAPQLSSNKFIAKLAGQKIKLNLVANGTMKSIKLDQLLLNAGNYTAMDISGNIKNPTRPDKLFLDLKMRKIQSSAADLKMLLPAGILPASVSLPATISVSGKHKGSLSSFFSDLSLKTSSGNALIVSDIKNISSKQPEYNVKLTAQHLNVGKIIKQPDLGPLSGVFKVKGKGFDKNTTVAEADMAIHSIRLQTYTYHKINLKGNYNQGLADITADVNDTNLAADLRAKANILKGQETYSVNFKLKGIDLYRLNLTKEHIQVSAVVNADFKGNSAKNMSGGMTLKNIMVVKKNKEYRLDSMMVVSVNKPSLSSLNFTSSLISGKFEGNIDLLSVVPTVQAHIQKYFDIGADTLKREKPQSFGFEVRISEDPFVREVLLPSLNDYRAVHLTGAFDSEKDLLAVDLSAPYVEYGSFKINQLKLAVSSDREKLTYSTSLASFINGSLQLEPTTLAGSVAQNKAFINLLIQDKNKGSKLALQSELVKNGKIFRYSLLENGFSIMDQAWTVTPDNYVEFGGNHLYVHNVLLSHAAQSISVNSTANSKHADLLVNIKDFKLRTLSQIAETKDSLFKGTVNGSITLKNYQDKPAFTSDLKLTELRYKTSELGNLTVKAGNINSAKYQVFAQLSGLGNDVNIQGNFNPQDTGKALDFTASIRALQMASIESFTGGELRKSTGWMTGSFTVRGSTSKPAIRGDINFVEARTNVKYLNQTLYMQKESISFSENGIHFKSFHIRDSLNNMASIAGDVKMNHFKDIHFDLQVKSEDFMVINTTAVQNKLYYGKVILDSDIKIKGTPDLPKIIADINISKGSHFTFAVPESKLTVDRGEGVVVFLYDPDNLHPIMLRREKQVVKSPVLKGIDLSARVKVRPSSTFKILVDPVSGDSLVVRGDADINFGIDPSGKVSLSGIYEISEGKYKAFIEGITSKEFLLVKGSKIIWNGDPMDALVDLQAQYKVKTSARELMSIGGTGLPAGDVASDLARPLNFEVYLIMEGELLKPELSFRLDMADNQKNVAGGAVYAKLNEVNLIEAERNKQVFSLLVLSKFMSSNAPGGGTTASGFARSSVSRMMSDQLNQLSSQYLKGVEVNVDLQSYDYNQGGQTKSNTQANVSVKKNFDRLSVQVGSNVKLEGASAKQSNTKNFTGDVEIGYKLTRDGRYQAKAFRQNEVDGIANGIITETGVGIMYTRDYNKTKDLLKPPKKRRKDKNK